jgi:hypothetical protein
MINFSFDSIVSLPVSIDRSLSFAPLLPLHATSTLLSALISNFITLPLHDTFATFKINSFKLLKLDLIETAGSTLELCVALVTSVDFNGLLLHSGQKKAVLMQEKERTKKKKVRHLNSERRERDSLFSLPINLAQLLLLHLLLLLLLLRPLLRLLLCRTLSHGLLRSPPFDPSSFRATLPVELSLR